MLTDREVGSAAQAFRLSGLPSVQYLSVSNVTKYHYFPLYPYFYKR